MLDILLEIVLCLLVNPLLEIVEVECVGVGDLLDRQPFFIAGEIVIDLFSAEDAIDHMTAEQPQLYLVAGVGVHFAILVDGFEDVGSS